MQVQNALCGVFTIPTAGAEIQGGQECSSPPTSSGEGAEHPHLFPGGPTSRDRVRAHVYTHAALPQEMLPTVHQLLRLYKTIPITSATSERTFSALRRLFTYLRSSMTERRLNNCLLLHVHKDITDSLDLISIASEFVCANDERKKYFGNF